MRQHKHEGLGGAAALAPSAVEIQRPLSAGALRQEFARDVREALSREEKALPSKWLFDAGGRVLWAKAARLSPYSTEQRCAEVLSRHAEDVARHVDAQRLVLLGPCSWDASHLLVEALEARCLEHLQWVDLCEPPALALAEVVARLYPSLSAQLWVADASTQLDRLPRGGTRLFAQLGLELGGLSADERALRLPHLTGQLEPGDGFVFPVSLRSGRAQLWAAHQAAPQLYAELGYRLLHRVNRELGADFRSERFAPLARFDERQGALELCLVSTERQTVRLSALDCAVPFAPGEALRTLRWSTFGPLELSSELVRSGLTLTAFFPDGGGDFALALARRR